MSDKSGKGPACFLYIGEDEVEFESRNFAWESDALSLCDSWSVVLPAPDGKAVATDGRRFPVSWFVNNRGIKVRFRESDPDVDNGAKHLKMTGRLWTVSDSDDPNRGLQLNLSGFDLGIHLTSGHGEVFKNIRGVKWPTFIAMHVTNAALRWGFTGVRLGNLENKRTKIGPREAIDREVSLQQSSGSVVATLVQRYQIEVGQSIGPILIEAAKWQQYLLNVSADGWLQFYKPAQTNTSSVMYWFFHEPAEEMRRDIPRNNVFGSRLSATTEGMYTDTQCWTSIVRRPQQAPAAQLDYNFGRYSGTFKDPRILPFTRRNTYTDQNQIGKANAEQRAKWMHDRSLFDSFEYSFRTYGHSQNGVAFIPDTICSLRDSVRDINGLFFVQKVRCVRDMVDDGIADGGSYAEITLRLPDMLGA